MTVPRAVSKVFHASKQAEGVGALVRRAIGGSSRLAYLSPFLLFDHFEGGDGAFPDHPHRGQETVSYVLRGSVDHEDFAGNKGVIGPGDLQFMTAGRGIMHSEQPIADNGVPSAGFQLWVDLPRHLKMCEPRYRDLRAAEIPLAEMDGGKVHIKVISGRVGDVESPGDLSYTPVWYLDVEIQPGGKLTQPLPAGWNAFAYTYEGSALFGPKTTDQRPAQTFDAVIFDRDGDTVEVEVGQDEGLPVRFLLIAGQPLDQPIVQHGPFVMNTRPEVQQAFEDFYMFKNGFERAKGWRSSNIRRRESF
ncbi:RmlC-like cupin domain-containing protein [Plectosphaerella plurivora]|uniref:RmlC-like cupin domain-containing protein n=1 Tax=Plectosphaerella plurivora TaxID=936078 RepID=A0A9P8V0X1_9PEZI|nr:RmlC-like cupin domain-containing protein [Plectosphaerella plurivora]